MQEEKRKPTKKKSFKIIKTYGMWPEMKITKKVYVTILIFNI